MLVDLKSCSDLPELPEQHAFVDEVASIRNAAWLLESGDFDYASFAELCNLIEAIVLYDKLYTCPLSRRGKPPSIVITSDFVKGLVSEGIITYLDWPTDLLYPDSRTTPEANKYRKGLRVFKEGKKKGLLHIEHLFGVGLATVHKMHIHPSISNARAYVKLLRVSESIDVSVGLLRAYKAISKSVSADLEQAIQARGQTYIQIPPIPLEIFKSVSKPDEILEEALIMRQKFQSVRKTYAEYARTIKDDSIPIKKTLAAQAKLKQVLAELSSRYGSAEERCILEWTSVDELAEAVPEFSQGDPTSLIQFFLGKPLEWIHYWLTRRKFMQLYRLKQETLKTIGYDLQINRLWGKSVDFADQPPSVLDENVDYPRGSEWIIYQGDYICLWSWSGKYIGYRRDNQLFSKNHLHVGRFVDNEVYSIDGNYLGELQFGRLVRFDEHKDKVVSSIRRVESWGPRPFGTKNRDARALVKGLGDFQEA